VSLFLDGPAAGATLSLRRAPYLLRVIVDTSGGIDALDQLDDEPTEEEEVFVYALAAPPQKAHVCYGGKDRHRSGWFEFGIYRHLPDVDGERLRETTAWRVWATAHADADRAAG
jgi:hypothetical protein